MCARICLSLSTFDPCQLPITLSFEIESGGRRRCVFVCYGASAHASCVCGGGRERERERDKGNEISQRGNVGEERVNVLPRCAKTAHRSYHV